MVVGIELCFMGGEKVKSFADNLRRLSPPSNMLFVDSLKLSTYQMTGCCLLNYQ